MGERLLGKLKICIVSRVDNEIFDGFAMPNANVILFTFQIDLMGSTLKIMP